MKLLELAKKINWGKVGKIGSPLLTLVAGALASKVQQDSIEKLIDKKVDVKFEAFKNKQ